MVTGFKIPMSRINRRDVQYFYNVVKNAKCSQVDIYYDGASMCIGADSLETGLVAYYKIPLVTVEEKKVSIALPPAASTSQTGSQGGNDGDGDDFQLFDDGDDILSLLEKEDEAVFLDSSKPQVTPPTPLPFHPVPVQFPKTQEQPQPQLSQTQSQIPQSQSTQAQPSQPLQSQSLQSQMQLSQPPLAETDKVYFSTLLEFLQGLIMEEDHSKEISITVSPEISTVSISGFDFKLEYPTVGGCKVDQTYYTGVMKTKTWERVDAESLQKVAKAISSTNKATPADMFVSVERSRVYSDNSFLVISAKTWEVQGRYYFTYPTIPALTKLPTAPDTEVYVSRSHDMVYLKYGDMYYAWLNDGQVRSENIFDMVDLDKMVPVMSISSKTLKKFRTFSKMFSSIQVDKDPVIVLDGIAEGCMKLTKDGNIIMLSEDCIAGFSIEVDINAILTASTLCTTAESKNNKIKVRTDFSVKDNQFLLFSNGLDVLISVEKITKADEGGGDNDK